MENNIKVKLNEFDFSLVGLDCLAHKDDLRWTPVSNLLSFEIPI